MEELKEPAVTIIGAGTSSLAAAAYLRHLSIPYRILEREDCFASIWQKYSYDRLHLHLPKQICQLPLVPFPSHYPTFVPKDMFVSYLNDYVSLFDIKPMYGRAVVGAAYDEVVGKWKVRARNVGSGEMEEYESRFVVVATGESCDPRVPDIEGLGSFRGEVMHSTRYKNGERFKGKSVLVVGSGNSGMEIAFDLSNYWVKTSIVIRSPMHILSKEIVRSASYLLKFLSFKWIEFIITIMSKIVYGNLSKYGIQRPKDGPFTAQAKYGKYPIIDVGTVGKIKSGEIQVLRGIKCIKGNIVLFENEEEYPFDAIILATGFKRPIKQWLQGDDCLINEDGLSEHNLPNNHWKGKNGLYCVGLARKGFSGAAKDAEKVANDIKDICLS